MPSSIVSARSVTIASRPFGSSTTSPRPTFGVLNAVSRHARSLVTTASTFNHPSGGTQMPLPSRGAMGEGPVGPDRQPRCSP